MTPSETIIAHSIPDEARRRLLSVKGDPFLYADWEKAVFLHFAVPAGLLERYVPPRLRLDCFDGEAWFTLVSITMRRFRAARRGLWPAVFGLIKEQRFLNARTYVRFGEEPGALFLWGWLSSPFGPRLPAKLFRTPSEFATIDTERGIQKVRTSVTGISGGPRLTFHGAVRPGAGYQPCATGSLEEFTLERYAGFYVSGQRTRIFRAWHAPWLQAPLDVILEERALVSRRFPWFDRVELTAANVASGVSDVWLGRPHPLETLERRRGHRRALSSFYRMP